MKKLAVIPLFVLLFGVLAMAPISSADAATPAEIEAAADKGLTWLVAQQYADGSWSSSYKVGATGLVVLKLETHAVHQGINPLDPNYEYYNQTKKGLDYLFSRAVNVAIGMQPAGNPDTDGDGIGVVIYYDGSHSMYETSIAAMAIAASNNPDTVITVGSGAVIGKTFKQVLVDMVDYIAWGQNDGTNVYRGGWRYSANYGSSDNSVSGWATLALVYAESPAPIGFGLTIPAFVKTELNYWLNYIQYTGGGTFDGSSGYTGPTTLNNILKTGNLLQQFAFVGDPVNSTRVQKALAFVGRWWNHSSADPGWKNGTNPNEQAAYCVMKGLSAYGINLIDTNGDTVPELDWFEDMTDIEVLRQIPVSTDKGYWASDGSGVNTIFSTAWALLCLEKEAPPVVKYDLTVLVKDSSTGNPIAGASVSATGPESRSDTTNSTGYVVFSNLLTGGYDVDASKSGYQSGSTSVTMDDDKTIEISLVPSEPPSGVPEFGLPAFAMLSLAVVGLLLFRRFTIPNIPK